MPTVRLGVASNIISLLPPFVEQFQTNARFFTAVEADDLMSQHLFSYCDSVRERLERKASLREKRLDRNDREMCEL